MIEFYDPTAPCGILSQQSAQSTGSLQGKTVGLLDNGWASWEVVGPLLREGLRERFGVGDFVEFRKPNSAPASPEALEALRKVDAVVSYIGNCGSCTMWEVTDSVGLVKDGVPTVQFVTEPFETLARVVAKGKGVEDLPLIVLPADFEQRPEAAQREQVPLTLESVATALGVKITAEV